eukprot:CAMPEP_0184495696 /NCGR_PEP_ID=MMETSP0113_2-20130426/32085_1 /TAXON_ID=91329 /ORGANISM="Norrisiella sphaerica, Strain BC52" /LENGTH=334 /DNA_ID=CAMNT_0026881999 /DNA_START=83 /DNA_END=1084 /DNA_ORIENTATION=-
MSLARKFKALKGLFIQPKTSEEGDSRSPKLSEQRKIEEKASTDMKNTEEIAIYLNVDSCMGVDLEWSEDASATIIMTLQFKEEVEGKELSREGDKVMLPPRPTRTEEFVFNTTRRLSIRIPNGIRSRGCLFVQAQLWIRSNKGFICIASGSVPLKDIGSDSPVGVRLCHHEAAIVEVTPSSMLNFPNSFPPFFEAILNNATTSMAANTKKTHTYTDTQSNSNNINNSAKTPGSVAIEGGGKDPDPRPNLHPNPKPPVSESVSCVRLSATGRPPLQPELGASQGSGKEMVTENAPIRPPDAMTAVPTGSTAADNTNDATTTSSENKQLEAEEGGV